uniref:Uncharacterized protein n=1 Tax=Ditylenchus dipsaci TaxID=166011 RepID=A0A915EP26_9BILA
MRVMTITIPAIPGLGILFRISSQSQSALQMQAVPFPTRFLPPPQVASHPLRRRPRWDGKQGRQRREAVAPSPLFYSRSLQPQPPIRWRIWSGGGCGSVGEELENKGLCSSRRRTRPSNSIPQPHNSRRLSIRSQTPKLNNISSTSFADFVANSTRSSHPIIKEEECSMLKEESDELLHSLGMPDQEELEDEPVNNSGQISPTTTERGGQFLERFACINCKKLSRQTQSSSFAPCLTLMVQQANKEIHLLNHHGHPLAPISVLEFTSMCQMLVSWSDKNVGK